MIVKAGAAGAIGIVSGFLLLPLIFLVQKKAFVFEKARMVEKDKRVGATQDFLASIKGNKMTNSEGFWVEKIEKLRRFELDEYYKTWLARSALFTIMTAVPILQSLLTFLLRELVFQNEP